MDILVIILLFVAFYQTRVMHLKRAVQLMALQSALLTIFCLSIASNWHRFNVNSAVYLFKKNWTQLL